MRQFIFFISLFSFTILLSCKRNDKLPQLGRFEINENDTIYLPIQPFAFIDQDSLPITSEDYKGKIYIADFIFLNCPTICPIMTNHLMKLYASFKDNPNVFFLSHSIDPVNDRPSVLKTYTNSLGIDTRKWKFATGEKEAIYKLANESYFTIAQSDSLAPGGYIHGGGIFLVDQKSIIRGVYDGTDGQEINRLLFDLNKLLKEED